MYTIMVLGYYNLTSCCTLEYLVLHFGLEWKIGSLTNPDYNCARTQDFLKALGINMKEAQNPLKISETFANLYQTLTPYQRYPISPKFAETLLKQLCTYGGEEGIKQVKGVMEDLSIGIFFKE